MTRVGLNAEKKPDMNSVGPPSRTIATYLLPPASRDHARYDYILIFMSCLCFIQFMLRQFEQCTAYLWSITNLLRARVHTYGYYYYRYWHHYVYRPFDVLRKSERALYVYVQPRRVRRPVSKCLRVSVHVSRTPLL